MIIGDHQADTGDQPAAPNAAGQEVGSRRSAQRPAILATSAASTAAVAPVAMTFYMAPRWVGFLVILLFILTSMLCGVVGVVIPQESDDRLKWWREWLQHRERMAKRGSRLPGTRLSVWRPTQLCRSSDRSRTHPWLVLPCGLHGTRFSLTALP